MSTTAVTEALSTWITEHVAAMLEMPESAVGTSTPFAELGLSSRRAVELSGDLEVHLGRALSPTLVYDYPTVDELVAHLTSTGAQA